jgi:phytoene synthase
MTGSSPSSAEITKRARSNLAFALLALPAERRRDMVSFYAFCRVVDDIADEETHPIAERKTQLQAWKNTILHGAPSPDPLLDEVLALAPKYHFDPALLAELIDGVASDLGRSRFETFEELLHYCYQVASVVGLVSICIFGHSHPDTQKYALHLGYALQLTNILRDVGQDARDTGRIYLPLEDLRNAHSPILVLHHAVALAGIADTGPVLPLLTSLSGELIAPIDEAAKSLLALELAAR